MDGSVDDGRAGLKPHREMPVPELDEGTLPEAHVSRRETGVARQLRALTS